MIVGHAPYKQDTRNEYKILILKPEGKKNLEDLSIDGRMLLKYDLTKYGREDGLINP
jgi:hypothetical protein